MVAVIVGLVGMRRGEQPPWIVSDESWQRIEPLLPVKPRRFRSPGRRRLRDRLALQGTLFVLHTRIQWEFLPQHPGDHEVRVKLMRPQGGGTLLRITNHSISPTAACWSEMKTGPAVTRE